MALFNEGFQVEMLYRVNEEVLGTTFGFYLVSGSSGQAGSVRMAEAFIVGLGAVQPLMGSNVKFDGVRVAPVGFNAVWSHEEIAYLTGTALTESVDELAHLRLNIQSTEEEQKVVINRNQIAGVPAGVVTNGRVDNAHAIAWTDLLDTWGSGALQAGGFQFFLGCSRITPLVTEFRTAARYQCNPFLGTRIDRIKNRPNTGSPPPVAPVT